jgi:hypothetical protein
MLYVGIEKNKQTGDEIIINEHEDNPQETKRCSEKKIN